jgi:hypothetical protein
MGDLHQSELQFPPRQRLGSNCANGFIASADDLGESGAAATIGSLHHQQSCANANSRQAEGPAKRQTRATYITDITDHTRMKPVFQFSLSPLLAIASPLLKDHGPTVCLPRHHVTPSQTIGVGVGAVRRRIAESVTG